MKIKTSIYLGFAAFLTVICVNTWVGYRATHQLNTKLNYISGPAWDAADGAMEGQIGLQSQIIFLQKVYYGEMSAADAKPEYLAAIAMEVEALTRMNNSKLISDKTISELNNFLKVFHATRDRLWSSLETGQKSELEYKNLNSQITELLAFIGKMEEEADSKVEGETENVEHLQHSSKITLLIVLLFGTVLSVMFILIARQTILNPITDLIRNLNALSSGDGDLTARLTISNVHAEMGELANSFNRFIEKLQVLINQAQQSNTSLLAANSQINNFITRSASGSAKQVEEISRVADSIAKITSALEHVGVAAQEANSASDNAVAKTNTGNSLVAYAQQGVDDIVREVENASAVIAKLVADSQNISSMLEVIRSIAEQTNLLALNAAIEAARAGESGRGFSVVADEVRSLASRTQESTKAIEEIIANLSNGSGKAVSVMGDAQSKAMMIKERIAKTSDAFVGIVSIVDTIKQLNARIASSSDDEKGDMHIIRSSMNAIVDTALRNREISEEASQAQLHLEREVQKIDYLMKQFRA